MQKIIELNNFEISNDSPLTIISGPCQLESVDHSLMIAEKLMETCHKFGANFIFKGSFDKANRTSMSGKRGLGIEEGLQVMQEVKLKLGCATITDVHTAEQCSKTAEVVDILQVPAFLCRQTDLLLAAAKTEAILNIKNGLDQKISGDLLSVDINEALMHLGEITGEITTEDLLGNVFANFCIGK